MYYYEQSFLNNQPCYIVVNPDDSLKVFKHETDAKTYVDWLNLIQD